MREKIKNILSSSYTKQGEFDEYKALNELCVLLGVVGQSEQLADKGRYCNDCGDYVGKGCDNSDCKDFKG